MRCRTQVESGISWTSANSTTATNQLSMSDRRIGVAVRLMFVLATGQAPLRAAASQELESATTTTTTTTTTTVR
eukprot:4805251-Amphidinium_carterae.1